MGVESVPNRTRHLANILFYGGSHPSLSYFQNVPGDACEIVDFACLGLGFFRSCGSRFLRCRQSKNDEEWRHTRNRENGPDLKGLLPPLISEGKYPFPGRPV